MKHQKKYVLGIAGYIGSGKSTAGKFFEKLGVRFLDADEVVDELYRKGADGYRKILNFFGEDYFTKTGELNRRKLAKTVFGDPKKLKILHDLVHPLVTSHIQKIIDRGGPGLYAIEATYFEKKHLQSIVDAILWIECPKEILFQRLQTFRPMERGMFEKILRIQVKPLRIDFIVDNSGTKKDFETALGKIREAMPKI